MLSSQLKLAVEIDSPLLSSQLKLAVEIDMSIFMIINLTLPVEVRDDLDYLISVGTARRAPT